MTVSQKKALEILERENMRKEGDENDIWRPIYLLPMFLALLTILGLPTLVQCYFRGYTFLRNVLKQRKYSEF